MASANSTKKSAIDWQTILISSLSTFIVTVAASFALYYFTLEKPSLIYEKYPPSSFITNLNKTSIINAKIENNGDKEADQVVAIFKFNEYISIQETSIELSSPAIKYTVESDTSSNALIYNFPTLNSSEKCSFSFLLKSKGDSLRNSDVEISLRGKGINGKGSTSVRSQDNKDQIFILTLFALSLLMIVSLFVLVVLTMRKIYRLSRPDKREISIDALHTAVEYCDLGLFDESIRTLKYAVYKDPSFAPLHANLARAYANKGMFDLAFSELKIAESYVGIDQEDRFINDYIYAQVYSLKKEYDKAVEYFTRAINVNAKTAISKALSDEEFVEIRQYVDFSNLLVIK